MKGPRYFHSTAQHLVHSQGSINQIICLSFLFFFFLAVLDLLPGTQVSLVAVPGLCRSRVRKQTHVPCIERQILNHWATREAPDLPLLVPSALDVLSAFLSNRQMDLGTQFSLSWMQGILSKSTEPSSWLLGLAGGIL